MFVAVESGHLQELSPGCVKSENAGPIQLDGEAVDEALTLADFETDIGKAAAELSDGTFYASTEELTAGLSKLAERSES